MATTSSLQDIRDYINATEQLYNHNMAALSASVLVELNNLGVLQQNVAANFESILSLLNQLPTASAPIPPAPTGSTPIPTGSAPQPSGSISFTYSFNNMTVGELVVATAMLGTSPVTSSVSWKVVPTGVVSLTPDLWTARLTGVAPGNVTLTATLSDGRTYAATGSVVGTTPPTGSLPTGSVPTGSVPTGSAPVVIKTISITPNPLNLAVGQNGKMTVKAVDASGKDITAAAQAQGLFTLGSANTALMTVDQAGNVHAISPTTNVNVEVHVGNAVPTWAGVVITGSAPPPPPPATSSFSLQAVRGDDVAATVGIGAHFSYTDLLPYGANQAKTLQMIKDAGFRWVRDGLNCDGPPPTTNNPFWKAYLSLVNSGVKLSFVTLPQYLGNNKFDVFPYTQQSNIDFAINTLGASNILAFEGPNEVDNNSSAWGGSLVFGTNAAQFQTNMYNRVKSLAPSIKVIGLTVTSQNGASHVPDLSAIMDGQTMHPYPGGQLPANAIAGEKAFLGQYMNKSNKPYWITETGYYTSPNATANVYQPGVSEAAQAKYTPRVYLMSVLNGIAFTSIYEFIDEHSNLADAEANYGLVRNDGTPKPAYTAMKNLMALLNEKTVAGQTFTPGKLNATFTGMLAPIQSLVMQKSDGRYLIAIWQEVSVYNTSTKADIVNGAKTVGVSLGQSFSKVNIYTPTTSATPITTSTNPASFNINVLDQITLVELIP